MLLDRLDPYGHDVGGAQRFEQDRRVGGIGLVAFDIGPDVLGGQQFHIDVQAGQITRPVMGGAAGFHDDERGVAIVEPAFELAAGEAVGFDDFPGSIGNGQLENGLGKVNGYGSRLHVGLLSLRTSDPHPHEDQ